MNLSKDHPDWLEEVDHQKSSNSCAANATAAAYRYLAHKLGVTSPYVTDPSRLFIYYNARVLPVLEKVWVEDDIIQEEEVEKDGKKIKVKRNPGDIGCNNRFAFQSINKWGVCSEPGHSSPRRSKAKSMSYIFTTGLPPPLMKKLRTAVSLSIADSIPIIPTISRTG